MGAESFASTPGTRYQHLCRLARGGMGEVNLVVRQHGSFERRYALKRLRPELRDDPDLVAMFSDEARLAGLIHHPNVVSAIDMGEDDGGPYLVMEHVNGVTVRTLLATAGELGIRIPTQCSCEIARQTALGLGAVHAQRDLEGRELAIVHRDVSPQNILLGFDGVVRITDFGIARALRRRSETTTGILKGKMGYLAPEQLRFERVDRRADYFTLGVVFFEMLTGQRLYDDDRRVDIPRRILEEPAPDLGEACPDAHPALVELMFELLAKSPEDRPGSAAEIAARLEAISSELAVFEGRITVDEWLRVELPELERSAEARLADLCAQSVRERDVDPPASATRETRRGRRRGWHLVVLGTVVGALFTALVAGAWLNARETAGPKEPPELPAEALIPTAVPATEPPKADVARAATSQPRSDSAGDAMHPAASEAREKPATPRASAERRRRRAARQRDRTRDKKETRPDKGADDDSVRAIEHAVNF